MPVRPSRASGSNAPSFPKTGDDPTVAEAFGLCLFLTILTAHFSLLITGQLGIVPSLAILFFFIGGVFFQTRLRSLSRGFWTGALLGGLLVSLFIALAPGPDFESVFNGIVTLLVFAVVIRYFTRRTERDDLSLLVLCLLEVAAATVLTVSISFLFMLVLFMALVMSSLMLLVIRSNSSIEDTPVSGGGRSRADADWGKRFVDSISDDLDHRSRVPLRFFRTPSLSALVLLLVGFSLFFVIPRAGRGLFSWKVGDQARVTGFANRVELGGVGRVIESRALVMRVKIAGDSGREGPLYFRGAAFDRFDGSGWSDSLGPIKNHLVRFPEPAQLRESGFGGELVMQEVILEPIESNALFGLPWFHSVTVPFKFRGLLEFDNDYLTLAVAGPISERIMYSVKSRRAFTVDEACAAPGFGFTERERQGRFFYEVYLELPPGRDRLRELAAEVAGGESDWCGKAVLLRDYLLNNYRYDLQTPSDEAEDPIHDFLFNSRRGYCEHFATAMALMLRSQGVPCRIGAGYLGGEFNEVEGFYQVRENHAHTWVEVYLPGRGWAMIDPTPPSPTARSPNPVWKKLSDLMEAVQYRWDRYVVELSREEQFSMLMKARDRGLAMSDGLRGWRRNLAGPGGRAIYFLAVVALIGGTAWWWWVRAQGNGPGPRRRATSQTAREYRALLRSLSRLGLERRSSETPLEFSARAARSFPALSEDLDRATRLYQEVRFGGRPFSDRAAEALRGVRRRAAEIRAAGFRAPGGGP